MPDSKHMKWADDYGKDTESGPDAKNATVDSDQAAANDADGWQKYRRWINKAPSPRGRRSSIDPTLYSWKGYRDWSDQVKRSWLKDSEGNDK